MTTLETAMQQTTVLAEVVDQSTSLIRALQEPGDIQTSGHHGL